MITKRDDASRGLTREELLALPAAVDLETANRALSLSRTMGYDLAKRGRYPCTVLRLGNAYRVVTADLLEMLHIDVPERTVFEEPTAVTPCAAPLMVGQSVGRRWAKGCASGFAASRL